MTAPMSIEAWRAAVAASRPPLTAAQLAILRPLWRLPQTPGAAPACETRAAPEPDADHDKWRDNSDRQSA